MTYPIYDPHVHFRDGKQAYKETIAHGLELAYSQGVRHVFDMPNTRDPILYRKDADKRLKLVPKKEKSRYFIYIGVTSNVPQLQEAIEVVHTKTEAIGLKMFAGQSVGGLTVQEKSDQRVVYQTLATQGYKEVLAVHCENEAYMYSLDFNWRDPYSHTKARPKIAEIESIKDQIELALESQFSGILHICHISCKESVDLIEKTRKETGLHITCGVTPHHLMWEDSKLRGDHGLLYKTNPPLRDLHDMFALRQALYDGKINWIETDHAPHTLGEKLHTNNPPSGYPSLYLYQDLLQLLRQWCFSEQQIRKITSDNIIETFKL